MSITLNLLPDILVTWIVSADVVDIGGTPVSVAMATNSVCFPAFASDRLWW